MGILTPSPPSNPGHYVSLCNAMKELSPGKCEQMQERTERKKKGRKIMTMWKERGPRDGSKKTKMTKKGRRMATTMIKMEKSKYHHIR